MYDTRGHFLSDVVTRGRTEALLIPVRETPARAIGGVELLSSPIHPRKISIGDQLLFEERPPRPGEMIKEAVQMAVWPALPSCMRTEVRGPTVVEDFSIVVLTVKDVMLMGQENTIGVKLALLVTLE
ncbi:hypothetical protein OSTOST_00768 [Ostertagia ostertagi]